MAAAQPFVSARNLAALLLAGASLAACATSHPRLATHLPGQTGNGALPSGAGGTYKVGQPYQVGGIWYVPREDRNYDATGVASWYGDEFHMKRTANGEVFDMNAVSAAHTTLPMPSLVEVTNLDNGRKLVVRVNDRGPFVGGRLIDLSHEAARQLGYDQKGLANVRVRYVGPAPLGMDAPVRYAANAPPPQTPSAAAAPRTPASTPNLYDRPGQAAPAYAAYQPTGPIIPPPGPVAAQPLPPLAAARSAPPPAAAAPVLAQAGGAYKIQAGAFGDEANAQRAVDRLSGQGLATIEPVERNGVTLYRVMLVAPSDEGEAWALRDRVASYGFADARVVRPF